MIFFRQNCEIYSFFCKYSSYASRPFSDFICSVRIGNKTLASDSNC